MNLRILKKTMWRLCQEIDAGLDPDGRKDRRLDYLRACYFLRLTRNERKRQRWTSRNIQAILRR